MRTSGELRLQKAALIAAARSSDPTRHKCFLSYHAEDADEVVTFVDDFGDVFIAKVLGISPDDDFVDSDDTDYVMYQIREEYLTDSTVTIVMVGKCTWSRKFVDWEIYSSLRNDKNNKRSGLMAITLPSAAAYAGKKLPARAADNVLGASGDEGYARWWKYPASQEGLRSCIEIAHAARAEKADLIVNTRPRRMTNASC
jgi:hypothetical protein